MRSKSTMSPQSQAPTAEVVAPEVAPVSNQAALDGMSVGTGLAGQAPVGLVAADGYLGQLMGLE